LLELSARLISIKPGEIGQEIDRGLKLTGEFWGFDQIILAELSDNGKEARAVHHYAAPGLMQSPLTNTDGEIPWLMEKIRKGETVLHGPSPGWFCLKMPRRTGISAKGKG